MAEQQVCSKSDGLCLVLLVMQLKGSLVSQAQSNTVESRLYALGLYNFVRVFGWAYNRGGL